MEDKISSELKLTELRRQNFRQTLDQLHDRASSILLLTLQWKDIEDHLDSTHLIIEKRAKELRSLHQDIKKREKEFQIREEEFVLTQRKEIEERKRGIEWIERSSGELETLSAKIDRKLKVLDEIQKRFESFNNDIEKRACDVKVMEGKLVRQIEVKKMQCQRAFNELKLKEKQIEERAKEIASQDESLNEQCKVLRLKELKFKDLEFKEKQIQERSESVELENKKVVEKYKEIELKERQLQERSKELELKEKHFDHSHNTRVKIEPLDTHVVNDAMDCKSDVNIHFSVSMDGKALQIFINERGVSDSIRTEILTALRLSSDPAKLVLDAMQGFYPPHLKKGDMEFEEGVVRRSCILLLEQLMKISPEIRPQVKKEAMGLACVWITKMKVDAEHSLEVLGFLQLLASYGLASEFDADELFTQLEVVAQHSQAPELLRVLGFADKISVFIQKLISKKQHIEAIGIIHAFKRANEFPPVLLLKDYLDNSKIAARRIRKGKISLEGQIEATEKIKADVKCALRCIENYNIECGPSLGSLHQMVVSLEGGNLNEKAKLAAKFKKGNSNMKGKLAASACKIQRPPWRKMKNLPRIVHGVDAPARAPKSASTKIPARTCFPTTTSTSLSAPMTQSQQQNGIKRSWIAMSEYDLNTFSGADQATCTVPFPAQIEKSSLRDAPFESKGASSSLDPQPKPKCFSFDSSNDNLRRLLTMDETHDLASEVAAALQLAFDPGKLVLDVMNASHHFNFRGNRDMKLVISRKNCILLLEQLRKVSPQINPEFKEEAKEFALYWEKRLEKNGMDPLEVICFLHFLAAYSLASTFTADQLLVLLDADDWHEKVPELVQALGLAEMIPNEDFIENLIKKEQRIEAVKYIFALDMVDKFPIVSILKDHLSNSTKEQQNEDRNYTKVQIRAINRELNALKAVWKCIADYNIQGLSPEVLEERILLLEKHKKEKFQAEFRLCSRSKSKSDQRPVSPLSAPTLAMPSNTQPQHQSGNKRSRSYASSRDHPEQHPPDVPNMNAPTGHCNRASYPTNNRHPNCYNPNVNSSRHRNTFGYPGHNRRKHS